MILFDQPAFFRAWCLMLLVAASTPEWGRSFIPEEVYDQGPPPGSRTRLERLKARQERRGAP